MLPIWFQETRERHCLGKRRLSNLPEELANASSLQVLKSKLKEWKPSGFVKHLFSTSVLSKLACYQNSIWNLMKKNKKNSMLDNIAIQFTLELIPPKKVEF